MLPKLDESRPADTQWLEFYDRMAAANDALFDAIDAGTVTADTITPEQRAQTTTAMRHQVVTRPATQKELWRNAVGIGARKNLALLQLPDGTVHRVFRCPEMVEGVHWVWGTRPGGLRRLPARRADPGRRRGAHLGRERGAHRPAAVGLPGRRGRGGGIVIARPGKDKAMPLYVRMNDPSRSGDEILVCFPDRETFDDWAEEVDLEEQNVVVVPAPPATAPVLTAEEALERFGTTESCPCSITSPSSSWRARRSG